MNVFCSLIMLVISLSLSSVIINIPEDYSTIQSGIDATADADTVLVHPGIYQENLNFNGKNITLAGLFLTTQDTTYISQTIIDGNASGSVVTFENEESNTAQITGFTLKNGSGKEILIGSHTYTYGGAIYCLNSDPKISFCNFKQNISGYGGGFYGKNSNVELSNINIENNSAFSLGGGICCISSTDLNINNCIVDDNSSYFRGGGVHLDKTNALLTKCTISNNWTKRWGGGIYCDSTNVTLNNCNITDNYTQRYSYGNGGGIYAVYSTLILMKTNIIRNIAYHSGGGVYSSFSTMIFQDQYCNIYRNFTTRVYGNDLYSDTFQEVLVDTFSVLEPTGFHAYPILNFTFNILHAYQPETGLDLYVSPTGDNTNSGLSWEDPLQNIYIALSRTYADSLHPVTIHLAEGIYSNSSNNERFPLLCLSYITLQGSGRESTILDGEEFSDTIILALVNADNCRISDLSIINAGNECSNGSGLSAVYSNFSMENVNINHNNEGIVLRNCSAELHNMDISYNDDYFDNGGGIQAYYSDVDLSNVNITGNWCFGDGAGGKFISSQVYCDNITVSHNYTYHEEDDWFSGGGFYVYGDNSSFECHNSQFNNNICGLDGGGIYIGFATAIIENVSFISNFCYCDYGGGISWQETTGSIKNCLFHLNYSGCGCALGICQSSDLLISNCTFYKNFGSYGYYYHDALRLKDSVSVSIINSIIYNNGLNPIRIEDGDSELFISHCNIEGGYESIHNPDSSLVYWASGNFDADPCFMDSVNFELSEISPCIDAGKAYLGWQGEVLIDLANEQYNGYAPDLGWKESDFSAEIVETISAKLFQNYPNPFNPSTIIKFTISDYNWQDAYIEIFNLKGQKVRKLKHYQICDEEPARTINSSTSYYTIWDGKDEFGRFVASGVYFYQLVVDHKSGNIRKCVLLK